MNLNNKDKKQTSDNYMDECMFLNTDIESDTLNLSPLDFSRVFMREETHGASGKACL